MDKLILLIWLWSLFTTSNEPIKESTVSVTGVPSTSISNPVAIMESGSFNIDILADSLMNCNDCHDDILKSEVVHAPDKKDCMRCHVSKGVEHPIEAQATFKLKKKVPKLCYECHDPKTEKEFVHGPTGEGNCLLCHDIHNSKNMYLVKKDPVSDLCYECHDLKIPEGNMVHGAITNGNCTGCHNPHDADNAEFMNTSKLDRLCRKCHRPLRKEFKLDYLHSPFEKKDCFSCHNGHSSKEAHLSDIKTEKLCLDCHEDTHTEINESKTVHGAINKGKGCLNCHKPHGSKNVNILVGTEKEVCLSCHDKDIDGINGSILAISPSLKEGNVLHGPVALSQCSVCHKPHASNELKLLTMKYPLEQYSVATVDNFSLCFHCHEDELFESPTTVSATNFRDGNKNLHYIHIRGNRGRNCNLCHDMHGGENKHMIKKYAMYGNWKMPIKFEFTDKGGSCQTGCHEKLEYERGDLQD